MKSYNPVDMAMKKQPFLVKAVYACIKYPVIEAISSHLEMRAQQIHRELGDNGIYLSVCMQPEEEKKLVRFL